jgi:hypothetical protein
LGENCGIIDRPVSARVCEEEQQLCLIEIEIGCVISDDAPLVNEGRELVEVLLLQSEEPVSIDSGCNFRFAKGHTFVSPRLAQCIAKNTHARDVFLFSRCLTSLSGSHVP